MKSKIIAIFGKSASGKDTVMKEILKYHPEYQELVHYTSRPPREGEEEGKAYHFVSYEDFCDLIISGQMAEFAQFRNWLYGTKRDDISDSKINIGVFSPRAVAELINSSEMGDESDYNVLAICIAADDKERLIRQLNREPDPDIDEIIRRYRADKDDFVKIPFEYLEAKNTNGNTTNVVQSLLKQIGEWAKN